MRAVGLCGSLRDGSWNCLLLGAAAAALPPDWEWSILSGIGDLPAYDEASEPGPPVVDAMRRQLDSADVVIVSTPEYNGSVPGLLKNALDWASRPFPDNCLRGTPVLVVGATAGLFGAIWAQSDLRRVLTVIGADVIDEDLPIGMAHEAFEGGQLRDPEGAARLHALVGELTLRGRAILATRLGGPGA